MLCPEECECGPEELATKLSEYPFTSWYIRSSAETALYQM